MINEKDFGEIGRVFRFALSSVQFLVGSVIQMSILSF